jgi:chorismate synthase
VGDVRDASVDPVNPDMDELNDCHTREVPALDPEAGERMMQTILNAKADLDSVGGIVEACALHVPAGIGGAMYDGLESTLAPILFGIPAVKGVEFGAGFEAASLMGSENNDPFYFDGDEVKTKTNNHGGILGGITSGMPLIVRLAFKPTPSISIPQGSVDLDTNENTTLTVNGRHDPCVVTRAVPIVEAALAIGILDCLMEE